MTASDITPPPNILWITADQLRYDGVGSYGNEFVDTPNIDRLAGEGITFDNAFAQSPVCTPSRASFLTGRYPRTLSLRQNGQQVPPGFTNEPVVTRTLSEAGYFGGLAGKLHLAPCHPSVILDEEPRFDDGYTEFNWSHQAQPDSPTNHYTSWLLERGERYHTEPSDVSKYVRFGPNEELHQSTWCVDRALSFVERASEINQPWFFSINFFDPHHPFDPPQAAFKRYRSRLGEVPLPNYVPGELDNKPVFQTMDHHGAYNTPGFMPYVDMSDEDHRAVRAAYWAMIDVIDKQVGRLLNVLERDGRLHNTLVIFTADHGELLGDHGMYLKGPHFYEPSVKVPLIMKWDGVIPARQRVGDLVELTDIAPTLLEATGQPIPDRIQGRSLLHQLKGGGTPDSARKDVYCEYLNAMPWHTAPKAFATMLRSESTKIVKYHGLDVGELYDLSEDPTETRNLWKDAPALRQTMTERLLDRIAFTVDPLPARVADW